MFPILLVAILAGVIVGGLFYAGWTQYEKGSLLRRLLRAGFFSNHSAGIESAGIMAVLVGLCASLQQLISFDSLSLENTAEAELIAKGGFLFALTFCFCTFWALHSWSLARSVVNVGLLSRRDRLAVWGQFAFAVFLDSKRRVELKQRKRLLDRIRNAELTSRQLEQDNASLVSNLDRLGEQLNLVAAAVQVVRLVRIGHGLHAWLDEGQRAGRVWIAAQHLCELIASGFGGSGKCQVAMYIEDDSAPFHAKHCKKRDRLKIIGWTDRDGSEDATPPAKVESQVRLTSLIGSCVLRGKECWLPEQSSAWRRDLEHRGIRVPNALRPTSPIVPHMLLFPIPMHEEFPEGTFGVVQVFFLDGLPARESRRVGGELCRLATDLFDAVNRAVPAAKPTTQKSRKK